MRMVFFAAMFLLPLNVFAGNYDRLYAVVKVTDLVMFWDGVGEGATVAAYVDKGDSILIVAAIENGEKAYLCAIHPYKLSAVFIDYNKHKRSLQLSDSLYRVFVEANDENMKSRLEAGVKKAKEILCSTEPKICQEVEEKAAAFEAFKKKYAQYGVVVTEWDWSAHNEYSDFIDLSFSVFNPTAKKIKYAWITVTAKNAVGDPISYLGKSSFTAKGVGPVDAYSSASWTFENMFYSKVVDKVQISKVRVLYFDGTEKVIIGKSPAIF